MMDYTHFFSTKISDQTYQISDPFNGPNDDGKSLLPGKATRNSYVLIGDQYALLIDLALEDVGLHAYATLVAKKKVSVALTHGHIDHIYHLDKETEAWVHPNDQALIIHGTPPYQPPLAKCPLFHDLHDGDTLDLGHRLVDIIHLPGHTDGSVAFYDRNTHLLFSGDTLSRRLLYGMHTFVPVKAFCERLEAIEKMPIEKIYTAHDRIGLPKSHIELMRKILLDQIKTIPQEVSLPGVGTFVTKEYGNEKDVAYFSFCYKE